MPEPTPEKIHITDEDSAPSKVINPDKDSISKTVKKNWTRIGCGGLITILAACGALTPQVVNWVRETRDKKEDTAGLTMRDLLKMAEVAPDGDRLVTAVARYQGTIDSTKNILEKGNDSNLLALNDLVGTGEKGYTLDQQISCLGVITGLGEKQLIKDVDFDPQSVKKVLSKPPSRFSQGAVDKFVDTFDKCFTWEHAKYPDMFKNDQLPKPASQHFIPGREQAMRAQENAWAKGSKKELRSTSWRRG